MTRRTTAIVLTVWMVVVGNLVPKALGQCTVNELGKIIVSDNAAGHFLGGATAIEGDIAVVGATGHAGNGATSGAAYILHYDGASWIQQAILLPSDESANNYFGVAVAIGGSTVLVGAHGVTGGAYVFEKPAGGWADMTETAKLTASDGFAGMNFALALALSPGTIVVGASGDDDNGIGSGAAYVFERPASGWENMTQTAKLLPSDGAAEDSFGVSVALLGSIALIGAHQDDDNGDRSGSVYLFDRPLGGWADMTETGKILPPDGAARAFFGYAMAPYEDVVVISAPYDDDNGAFSGSVYVLRFDRTSWSWEAKLLASDGSFGDVFGFSVSIFDDIIVAGATREIVGGSPGSAYVFKKPAGGWVNMTENAILLPSDSAPGDFFSGEKGVALWDGIAVVGALYSDGNGENAGSAYAFHGVSDCNGNGTLDLCDVDAGTSLDVNGNGIPDECDPGACHLNVLTCVTHLSPVDCESQGGNYMGGATTCERACAEGIPAVGNVGFGIMIVSVIAAGGWVLSRRQGMPM